MVFFRVIKRLFYEFILFYLKLRNQLIDICELILFKYSHYKIKFELFKYKILKPIGYLRSKYEYYKYLRRSFKRFRRGFSFRKYVYSAIKKSFCGLRL